MLIAHEYDKLCMTLSKIVFFARKIDAQNSPVMLILSSIYSFMYSRSSDEGFWF